MYYLCSENKGADQLRGYREADLRLCFRICKTLVFLCRGSINGDSRYGKCANGVTIINDHQPGPSIHVPNADVGQILKIDFDRISMIDNNKPTWTFIKL